MPELPHPVGLVFDVRHVVDHFVRQALRNPAHVLEVVVKTFLVRAAEYLIGGCAHDYFPFAVTGSASFVIQS